VLAGVGDARLAAASPARPAGITPVPALVTPGALARWGNVDYRGCLGEGGHYAWRDRRGGVNAARTHLSPLAAAAPKVSCHEECTTVSEVRLAAEARTEFGKGAARRTRRAGKIPAVLYGHGSDPKHLALPALEFARVVREHGQNAVLTLEFDSATELALTKTVTTHPIKNYIEHVDLLLVQRGEKVTVEVPIVVNGETVPGNLVTQDLTSIEVSVEALHIPEQFEVSIEGLDSGAQIFAKDVSLPAGAELVTDEEALVLAVNAAQSATDADDEEEGETAAAEATEE
jgi:large subunit ribosomal protein L25